MGSMHIVEAVGEVIEMAARNQTISDLLARAPRPPMPGHLAAKVDAAIRRESVRRSAKQATALKRGTGFERTTAKARPGRSRVKVG
jgi:hypothetical protein